MNISRSMINIFRITYAVLLATELSWGAAKSGQSVDKAYYVPFRLNNATATSIFLSFELNTESFYFLLHKQFDEEVNPTQVYVVGKDEQPTLITTKLESCVGYKGSSNFNTSCSIQLCSRQWTLTGVIIRETDYLVLSANASNTRILKVEQQSAQGLNDNVFLRGLRIPNISRNFNAFRERRQSSRIGNRTVEVAIFTEHLLYKRYCTLYPSRGSDCAQGIQELTAYVKTIFIGADLFYDRIRNTEFSISLRLRAIIHNAKSYLLGTRSETSIFNGMELNTLNPDGNPQVDAAQGLERFAGYQQNFLRNSNLNYTLDQSSLITLHGLAEMSNTGLTTIGIAYVEGLCDSYYKSSVCQYKPDEYGWNTIYILAHEIGHNLGATHDGAYEQCPGDQNYIMSSYNLKSNLQNSFYFSCCSLLEMVNSIRKYGQCLEWVKEPDVSLSERMPGVVFDRSNQCSAEFGDDYVPCYDASYDPNRDGLPQYKASFREYVEARRGATGTDGCLSHWCVDPSKGECEVSSKHPVLSGTWCDIGKWCIEGKCIPNRTITPMGHSPTCDFGKLNLTIAEKREGPEHTTKREESADIAEIWGRFSGLIIGMLFFTVGVVGTCLKKRQPRMPWNRNRNNSDMATQQIPPQYKVAPTNIDTKVYSLRDYQTRVQVMLNG